MPLALTFAYPDPNLGGEQQSIATPRAARMDSPTRQTLQEPIVQLPRLCFPTPSLFPYRLLLTHLLRPLRLQPFLHAEQQARPVSELSSSGKRCPHIRTQSKPRRC
jgi:hypothetical protein